MNLKASLCVGACALALGAAGSAAAEGNQASRGGQVEELVVTAQRTAQSVQDVPVSITAIGGDALQRQGVSDLKDITRLVPNFTFRDAGANIQYNLRGSTTLNPNGALEGAVSVYVNDVYRASPFANDAVVFDLDRVEVLRGPQGTLFGRNSTGGLINFITKRPGHDFGGYANLSYGSYNRREVEAAVDLPLSDRVRTRLAIRTIDRDNWQKNLGTGGGDGFGAIHSLNGRLTIDANVTDRLEATLILTHQHNDNNTYANSGLGGVDPARFDPAHPGTTQFNCPTRDQLLAGQCLFVNFDGSVLPNNAPTTRDYARVDVSKIPRKLTLNNGTLNLAYDAGGGIKVTSLTSYEHFNFYNFDEFDGTDAFPFGSDSDVHHDQFEEELRVNGATGPLTWVAGAFYLNARYQTLPTPQAGGIARETRRTESGAVFANAEFAITDQWKVIGGIRYTKETKKLHATVPLVGTPRVSADGKISDSFVTGRGGVEFRPIEHVMIYATGSTGQKSGEFGDVGADATAAVFKPEKVTAFEFGSKTQWFDRRLTLNGDIFWQKTRNFQFGFPVLTSTTTATTNNSSIESYTAKGFELDGSFVVNEDFRIGGSGSYNKTRIHDPSTRKQTIQSVVYTLNGNQIPGTPKWKLTGYADYTVPLSDGGIDLHADYSWQSSLFWDISNNPYATEGAYGLANARITWRTRGDRLSITGFVDNAFDKKDYAALRFWLNGFPTMITQWGDDPGRTYGVRVGVTF
jgi:iron complex outermembrane receptor protein